MLFIKSAILALLALSSVAAEDQHLRAHRELTVCPDTPVDLKCSVLKSTDGTGYRGTFVPVGNVTAGNTLSLDSFDPAGCYNIYCETSDTSENKRLNWIGSHDKNSGNKVSSKTPYYLSGAATGVGCTNLAPSCAKLNITIQGARAPAPGVTDLSPYICSDLSITCKVPSCFTCPDGLIALKTCPTGVHECGCPANQVLVAPNYCEPCKTGTEFKEGKCVSVCPYGKKLDGSGYCVHDWCHANFICPANSKRKPDRECYDTIDDCQCDSGFNLCNGKCISKCPLGWKLDGSGHCVMDWCKDNYICPAKSHRTSGRDCYNDFDDCTCEYGYYKYNGYCKKRSWCWW